MKPYLEKKTMSDEELFEKPNVCVSNEMERSQKFGSQLATQGNTAQEGGDKQAKKSTEVEQALMKELRELKAEVAAVRERVPATPQAQNPPTQQPMRQPPQCRTCQQSGNGWLCNHCFRCGLVAIMCASVLPSLADTLLQNFRETVGGHAHRTGCDQA